MYIIQIDNTFLKRWSKIDVSCKIRLAFLSRDCLKTKLCCKAYSLRWALHPKYPPSPEDKTHTCLPNSNAFAFKQEINIEDRVWSRAYNLSTGNTFGNIVLLTSMRTNVYTKNMLIQFNKVGGQWDFFYVIERSLLCSLRLPFLK